MVELKKIGVLSAARMIAILSLIGGIIAAIFVVIALSVAPASMLSTMTQTHPVIEAFVGLGPLLLIVIPLLALALGFVVGAFEAWIYNKIAGKVGHIKLQLKNGLIASVDPVSLAKIIALISGVITIIAFILLAIGTAALGKGFLGLGILGFGIVFGILETIFVMVIEFVLFFVFVCIYNYLAQKIGGIKINIKNNELVSVDIISYAKMYGILIAIIGFIYGLFIALFGSLFSIGTGSAPISILVAIAIIIIVPILAFIFGFIYAAIQAAVYNALAPKIKGIKLYLA